MRRVLIMLLIFCLAPAAVSAEKEDALDEIEIIEIKPYEYPEIKPEVSLYGGYRYVNLSGAARVEEYEYLHDSISWGGELRAFSFPYRLHFELDFKNRKDYFGDVSYAYRDIILFRGINRTLFHNLDNIRLQSGRDLNILPLPPPLPPFAPAFEREDSADEKYGVKTGINSFFMRFKTPDFPFHLYIDGSLIEKDGTQQQRSLLGSGWHNTNVRTSQSRDIDLRTKNIIIGANSHLGPIEIDISHGEKRLDVGGDSVLYHNYTGAGFLPPFFNNIRPAGTFPHNLVPELKGSSNTLKIHTSYTGSLVAAATFTKMDRENKDSGAKADYFIGAGEVTWMPMPRLTFFVKYRHQERDMDNPDTVTVRNLSNDVIVGTYPVRNSISSVSDSVSGTVRYRPLKGVLLKADYAYEEVRRNDVEDWVGIPHSTQRHKLSLSGDVRIMSGLKLKAKYTRKDINNPATNTEPDTSDEGLITLSWTPFSGLNTYLSYGTKEEKREALRFVAGDPPVVYTADDRKVKNDRLVGTVSYVLPGNLSVTASYAYMHNKVQQDIMQKPPPPAFPVTDFFVPYKTTARNYLFDVNYSPKSFISLNGGISHTVSQGAFYPADSIASFSELKTRETIYSASGEYRFKNGFSAGIQYRYSTFKDVLDNIYDDVNDGRSSIILLTISKKW